MTVIAVTFVAIIFVTGTVMIFSIRPKRSRDEEITALLGVVLPDAGGDQDLRSLK